MGKKSKSPKLISGGTQSSATYLNVAAGSGAVTIASHAQPTLPQASVLTQSQALPSSKKAKKSTDTAGAAWGHMRAPQLTTELKRELLLLKMRGALDPKRFYRSADNGKELPKYFQIGTIVAGAEDGAANRLSKRERKGSIMQEMLSDATIRKRAKTQFLKVQTASQAGVKRKFKPSQRKGKAGGKRK